MQRRRSNSSLEAAITLKFTSCQADVAELFCRTLAVYIGKKLDIPTEFIGDIAWQERQRRFYEGDIDVCWMCSLPYVRTFTEDAAIELLAAPVMRHPRYNRRPVYYSDIVVRADSGFRSFDDLRGASWAYNEPESHSGYNLVRYHLALRGMGKEYFANVVESGSHQDSIKMILDRSIDSSAIDSTVLEMELARKPSIAEQLRTIAVLGPSPAPPWIVHRSVPLPLRQALRREFLSMDKDPLGRRILENAGVLQFTRVLDLDYDPIREMDRLASTVDL
jgi:ABC-type phosphate/phosphonate transport system substrate-binding protein